MREGINTVIVGKPNAGKSSLLNVLLGEDRAIVTNIAGTTRDVLEEHIQLRGISLNIMDTAGIRNTEDVVEQIGVDKARSYAEEADLIIYVVDASVPLDDNDIEIIHMIQNKNHGEISFNNEVYITNVRHKAALQDAYVSLGKVKESIENQMPEDFFTIDLMDAYESLGSITGETVGEDLVNEIFSKFCMGN